MALVCQPIRREKNPLSFEWEGAVGGEMISSQVSMQYPATSATATSEKAETVSLYPHKNSEKAAKNC